MVPIINNICNAKSRKSGYYNVIYKRYLRIVSSNLYFES